MSNWLKLERKIIDSRVFNCGDDFVFRLWIWCLAKANWKRGWAQDREIEPGQFVTGRSSAANEIGVSGSRWYRGMQRLVEFGNVKTENVNNRCTLVTVVNWRVYQALDQPDRTAGEQPPDSRRTTTEQPVNTIEEGKKEKKERREELRVIAREFVGKFNSIDGVSSIRKLSGDREAKLIRRLSDPEWPWREALEKLPLGGSWQPNFDWLVKNETNLLKLAEGAYDSWQSESNADVGETAEEQADRLFPEQPRLEAK